MVSCYKLLSIRSFVLEVRSWLGNDVPVNLYKPMLFSVSVILLSKKGQGPKAQPASSKVLVLAKRRQISAGSSLRARSPNPAKLSPLPRTQPTSSSVSSGCPKRGETRSNRLQPRQISVLFGSRDRDGGEVHCSRSGPRLVEGFRALEPCRT